MFKRRLGRSDLEVSGMGLGCWAIGGPWTFVDGPAGWGEVDDSESIRAIHYALDAGINFLDTAANYGCGHSEQVLARVLRGRRDRIILATKFGYIVDEEKKLVTETEDVVSRIREECEDSLRRLDTDHIDLYQFHVDGYDPEKATAVRDELEKLVAEGKIRWYGWSTNNPAGARVFAQGPHCTAIQHWLNIGYDAPEMMSVCEEFDLASIIRSPLVSGMLTGKFTPETTFPENDVRHDWNLQAERPAQYLRRIQAVRKFFGESGDPRSMAQVALAWIWTRSERAIPIPGFRSLAQVKENIEAMDRGLLTPDEMKKIAEIYQTNPAN